MQEQAQQSSGGEQPLLELSNVSKHFGGVMALLMRAELARYERVVKASGAKVD